MLQIEAGPQSTMMEATFDAAEAIVCVLLELEELLEPVELEELLEPPPPHPITQPIAIAMATTRIRRTSVPLTVWCILRLSL